MMRGAPLPLYLGRHHYVATPLAYHVPLLARPGMPGLILNHVLGAGGSPHISRGVPCMCRSVSYSILSFDMTCHLRITFGTMYFRFLVCNCDLYALYGP